MRTAQITRNTNETKIQLSVNLVPGIILGNICADIRIEQDRIRNPVAVLPEALDRDIKINSCPLIHHPKK